MSVKRFTALITGSPGTGKTTMALTAPRPIHFLDVDRKMHLLATGVDLEQVTWSQYSSTLTGKRKIAIRVGNEKNPTSPPGSDFDPKVFQEIVDEINTFVEMKEKGEPFPFQTLVLDTISRAGEHLEALVKKLKGHTETTQGDWRDYLNIWIEVLSGLISLSSTGPSDDPRCSCNIIVTTHDVIFQDELSKTVKILPALPGQIASRLGGFFQESYYLIPTIKDNRMSVDVLTHADSKYSLTSQLSDLVRIPADFRLILSGMFKGENAEKWMREKAQNTQNAGISRGGGEGRSGRL